MSDVEVVLTPGEVARRLGVSPSGLRRLATVYGQVHGELAKDASGTSRIWTPEAVRRLEAARALLATGRARSIKDALGAVEAGAEMPVEAVAALGQDGRILEALGVVTARLEAVLDSNVRLELEVAELRQELATMQALPPAKAEGMSERPMERRDGGPLVRLAHRLERWFK